MVWVAHLNSYNFHKLPGIFSHSGQTDLYPHRHGRILLPADYFLQKNYQKVARLRFFLIQKNKEIDYVVGMYNFLELKSLLEKIFKDDDRNVPTFVHEQRHILQN